MDTIIKDIENEEFKSDALNLSEWIADRLKEQRAETKERVRKLLLRYIMSEEVSHYDLDELEIVMNFYAYLDRNL